MYHLHCRPVSVELFTNRMCLLLCGYVSGILEMHSYPARCLPDPICALLGRHTDAYHAILTIAPVIAFESHDLVCDSP